MGEAASQDFEVAWSPTEKQTEFLTSSDTEVLYGGANGGGKTEALIYDAPGLNHMGSDGKLFNAIEHPKYWGLLIRRFAADIDQLEERCERAYKVICPGVVYNRGRKIFKFPSGARIQLGHGRDVNEIRSKYKGAEYQWIGFEELTEFPSPDPYTYLLTRLRGPDELGKFVRATSNPDGPGNEWVRERFRIGDAGESVPTFNDGEETRSFIRARVFDNTHIDKGYESKLRLQSAELQAALLWGRWDIYNLPGRILEEQYKRAMMEGRFGVLPTLSHVAHSTFWDLGSNDSTGVWCMQPLPTQHNFTRYIEGRHVSLEFIVKQLNATGYTFAKHYLPHDGGHRRLGLKENKTIAEMLYDLGLRNIEIVPRVSNTRRKVELARAGMATCFFDKDGCSDGIKALKAWRFPMSPTTGLAQAKPLHDWASCAADAYCTFTQGFKSEWLPEPDDFTPSGYRRRTREDESDDWVV